MYSRILALTTSALILAYGTVGAFAQNEMTPEPDQQQMQSHPMGQEGAGMMGHGSMMGGGMMGRGMMGGGAEFPHFGVLLAGNREGAVKAPRALVSIRVGNQEFAGEPMQLCLEPARRCVLRLRQRIER